MILTVPDGSRCCFCGGSALRRLYPRNAMRDFGAMPHGTRFPVVECERCAVAWRWPIEKVHNLSDYYDDAVSNRPLDDYFDPAATAFRTEAQADFVQSVVGSAGKLLDVGAGDGSFVRAMIARGWDAAGVEPSPPLLQRAHALGSGTVMPGTADDLPKEATFDAATMWDVIEHVEDPMSVIRSVASRLKVGGWLFIETGNYQSEDRITAGDDWFLWQADHRWYFAPPSVETMLRTLGFDNMRQAGKTFRPIKTRKKLRAPGIAGLIKSAVKAPHRLGRTVRTYYQLRRASQEWHEWAHIPIFAVGARLTSASRPTVHTG